MKLGLARGSFGSDYWHDCVYALDDPVFTNIKPAYPLGGGCPASGPAPGVSGRFIENVDFRATKADPRDPAISPSMKPMKQHEFVAGMDWEVRRNWNVSFRYARKRIDNTIEDWRSPTTSASTSAILAARSRMSCTGRFPSRAPVQVAPRTLPATTSPRFRSAPSARANGIQDKMTLNNRYGMPNLFQQARNIRLAVRFTF